IAPAKEGGGARAGRCSQRGGAVRVHRTSSGRRPGRAARLGFILAAVAAVAPARAPGDEGAGVGPDGRAPSLSLTADRVRNWVDDGVQYVLLEDHAAIYRGEDGLRAQRAAVRIASIPRPDG